MGTAAGGGARFSWDSMRSRLRVVRYRWVGRLHFDPPEPPESLAGGIGLGPFWATGRATVERIATAVDLRPVRAVVELGSGLGRLAWPLSLRLHGDATYLGLEVSRPYLDWVRRVLPVPGPRFRFEHLDLYNSHYNPEGTLPEERASYPVESSSVDLVIANSVFTHLLPPAISRSLEECLRILRPGGALFATFFLIDDASKAAILAGGGYPRLAHEIPCGRIEDPEDPAHAVGVDRAWLEREIGSHGLELAAATPGGWRVGAPGHRFQDEVVCLKPA